MLGPTQSMNQQLKTRQEICLRCGGTVVINFPKVCSIIKYTQHFGLIVVKKDNTSNAKCKVCYQPHLGSGNLT